MDLVIPEEIVKASQMTEQDMKLEIAIMLYQLGKISSGKVRTWTGLTAIEFQEALAERNLYLNYDVDDFEQDIRTLQAMNVL